MDAKKSKDMEKKNYNDLLLGNFADIYNLVYLLRYSNNNKKKKQESHFFLIYDFSFLTYMYGFVAFYRKPIRVWYSKTKFQSLRPIYAPSCYFKYESKCTKLLKFPPKIQKKKTRIEIGILQTHSHTHTH